MELYQVRYYLALCKTLNFTRAAEECNVSQPALSRAIMQLEGELGGQLFRRERNLTHLSELGQTVLPALRQCFDASINTKMLAREFLKEGHAPLNLALSRTIEMDLLTPMLGELAMAFPRIEIRMFRGPSHEIGEKLKNGEVEMAIAGPLGEGWERLDSKQLFREHFGLLLDSSHRLSKFEGIELGELKDERFLSRPHCPLTDTIMTRLRDMGAANVTSHEVAMIDDLPGLVHAKIGVGIWPVARRLTDGLSINHVRELDMSRWIHVHTVFGRRHSAAAVAFTNLLRTRDWPAPAHGQPSSTEMVH